MSRFARYLIIALLVLFMMEAGAARRDLEATYQGTWCGTHDGIAEFVLRDRARVDCMAKIDDLLYAIEFDFADKWAEAIGQALYYAAMTGREPGVVLIIENFDRDKKYIDRFVFATQGLGIRLWLVN